MWKENGTTPRNENLLPSKMPSSCISDSKGLPLTWKPDPTKRKDYQNPIRQMGGSNMPALPMNWNKGINNGIAYDCQILQTDKGIRKVYVSKTSGEVIVFEVKDGKEFLIK